jgi:hypothetical protein
MPARSIALIEPYLSALRARLKIREARERQVVPPSIHDDLSGLKLHEISQEISVIERRQELGEVDKRLLLPEGKDGLTYRLARLKAQKLVVERKGKNK